MSKKVINRKSLNKVIEMFIETETKQLVVTCADGNTYICEGLFNKECNGMTDYHFTRVDLVTDRPKQIVYHDDDEDLPF